MMIGKKGIKVYNMDKHAATHDDARTQTSMNKVRVTIEAKLPVASITITLRRKKEKKKPKRSKEL